MRRIACLPLLFAVAALAGCAEPTQEEKEASLGDVNAIDQNNLNDIMLTVADPTAAVEYFRRSLNETPDRAELKRGYAVSLTRAKRYGEARIVYRDLIESGAATKADRIEYAHALSRLDSWDEVGEQIASVGEGYVTQRSQLIRAMYADHQEDWATADAAYERARSLTTRPAPIYNNWGVSKMARGDMVGAVRAFEQAIAFDPDLFNAKNNLAIAYGLQREYRLPLVTLTEEERALLLHNLAVIALRQGDKSIAQGLLTRAVAIHPRHFTAAADKLAALESVVRN